jgi:hypothetical protein
MDKRTDGRSCHKHKGADIVGEPQGMVVVQKGKLTPWGTDHAKLTSKNRSFFARKATARGINLNQRVFVISCF